MFLEKCREKKGFTLAEILIVVSLMLVLTGVSVYGYTRWQRAIRFKHNNDVAETCFSVLQSELIQRRVGNTAGELEELFSASSDGETFGEITPYLANIVMDSGAGVRAGTDYDSIYTGYERADEKGPIFYAKGTGADWERYARDGSTGSPQLDALYEMLSKYMFEGDRSLLNGAICAEFDPSEGLVYSVFFAVDETGETGIRLSYGSNLLDRTKRGRLEHTEDRRHDLVGYCGVETLSVSPASARDF